MSLHPTGPRPAADPGAPIAEWARFLQRETVRAASETPALVLVTPAPAAPLEALLHLDPEGPAVLWDPHRPGPGFAGVGAARCFDLSGPDRFRQLERAEIEIQNLPVVTHPEAPPFHPAIFGGLAFAPATERSPGWRMFGDGAFVLPRWTYALDQGRGLLALALFDRLDFENIEAHLQRFERIQRLLARPAPASTPVPAAGRILRGMEPPRWTALVEAARSAIVRGEFQKVVLARETVFRFDPPADPAGVLARLQQGQPDCIRFAFRRGTSTFLGATPETLLLRRGFELSTEALAGTLPRPLHADSGAVEALGRELSQSAKDRAEHAFVVEAITAALMSFTRRIVHPPEPEIRVLPHVLHLRTPISATLDHAVLSARLIEALHPTPALGGFPRAAALGWIAAHEPFDRGWYAGPVGRIAGNGEAEFGVGIRSARIDGAEAAVFAGAGIVADSDPAAEYEETAVKSRAILSALGASL